MKMELTIRYNRTSVHIQGIPEVTTGPMTDTSSKTGVVSYYAQSACGGLTRSGHRMAVSDTYDNAMDALKGAALKAKSLGLKFCKNCEKAAQLSAEAEAHEEETPAPEVKPGRCLQRVAKVGKTPTQCVKGHAHEDDHEDRFGQTFANHAIVPGAEPLSPTAQALADAGKVRDEAMKVMYEAEGTDRQDEADAVYNRADRAYYEASMAHRAARIANGDDVAPVEPLCEASRYGTGDDTHLCSRTAGHQGTHRTAAGAAFENWTEPETKEAPKPKPFTFEYDATEGVLIAAALREKAKAERELAKELRISHDGIGAPQADNRAGLLSLAADRIHKPVHVALMRDFDKALTKAEEQPFSRKLKRDIGLKW